MKTWMRGALVLTAALLIPACGSSGDTFVLNVLPIPTAGTILYVGPGNVLINVTPAQPGVILSAVPLKSLQPGEDIVAIDYRPATEELYGLGSSFRFYRIDPQTGECSPVGSPVATSGTAFGFDFNPASDRARVVSDTDSNLRLDPFGGPQQTDAALAYDAGDPNSGTNPVVVACAHDSGGQLFAIDTNLDILTTVTPANNGTLLTRGALTVAATAASFDITAANLAYAALEVGGVTGLYTVNLATGAATLSGTLGTGGPVRGFTLVP